MYKLIISLDYEIHGNGDGDPLDLMIEPTSRMLGLFNKYGAKLTVFADVAEIISFKSYYEKTGKDKFHSKKIENQLKHIIKNGHDVQLHIHSSYLKSTYKKGKWQQNWDEYNLAELPIERIEEIIGKCKIFLENLLTPINQEYKCNVFRAANWSMMPSENILKVLTKLDFKIDSSLYKWGVKKGRVKYDYSNCNNQLIPWFVNSKNINYEDKNGHILEIPIYSENRYFFQFITPIRIYRMIRSAFHRHEKFNTGEKKVEKKSKITKAFNILKLFFKKHPWKLDINQANSKKLISACKNIENKYDYYNFDIPVVSIGHSKTFIKYNERTLEPFLEYIKNSNKYNFSLYNEIDINAFRNS